jgi:hypothetical protein
LRANTNESVDDSRDNQKNASNRKQGRGFSPDLLVIADAATGTVQPKSWFELGLVSPPCTALAEASAAPEAGRRVGRC